MTFDFDAAVDRRNSGSMKWDVGERELPMWVADMDFPTAPAVRRAIEARAAHGVFGYTDVSDAWYDAYCGWWRTRHGVTLEKDSLIFCTGVVPAISSMVRKLTTPAEKVVLLTPVYNIFYNSILNNGRVPSECPLVRENGEYRIDFAALEAALADPQASMMILCNPHNPIGKCWDKNTLEKIGNLCAAHHVTVIADEIHGDLTDPDVSYTPFLSVSDTCRRISVTCTAPTKTFNIAGLQTAAVIVPDPALRHRVWRGLNTDEVAEPNVFAVDATVAAFTQGGEWLDALRRYLYENKQIAAEFLKANLPEIFLTPSQATYLLWLDCSRLCDNADELAAFLRRQTGLYLSAGSQYGKGGEPFLRMNIACTKATLKDGLTRLESGVKAFLK